MSRTLVSNKFRNAWNQSKYLSTPTEDQLNQFIDRTCDEFTSRRRVDGQITSITVNAGEQEVALAIDWIPTAQNNELLRKIEEGLNPSSRNYGVPQLNYQNSSYGYGYSNNGLNNNLSRPLRPSAPQMRKPQIKRKKIDGVERPVWVLYEPAGVGKHYPNLTYQGRHRIENANCLLSINSNPAEGDQLIVEHNDLDEPRTLTLVEDVEDDDTQIEIGANRAATMENISASLADLSFTITNVKNKLSIVAPDGDDFTLTLVFADEVEEDEEPAITRVYSPAINTIPFEKEVYFYQILEALALRGMKSQRLIQGKSISDVESIATSLLTEALNAITPRSA